MNKRLRLFALFALVLVLSAGIIWWQTSNRKEPLGTLTLYGNIEIRDAQLAFQERERLSRVLVEEGDLVSQGQVLAKQEQARLRSQIKEAEAKVAASEQRLKELLAGTRPQEIKRLRSEVRALKTNADNLQDHYRRLRRTVKGAASEQDLEDAKAKYEVERARLAAKEQALALAIEGPRQEVIDQARQGLEAARASLELLRVRFGDLTLRAPDRGIVQSRILEPGEMAGPTSPVLTLALIDPKWVRAFVPEPELGRIEAGLQARVTSDSFPEKEYSGWIGFISPVAEFTPKNVQTTDLRSKLVYEVRVMVRDADNELRLGMPVMVQIDLDSSTSEGQLGSAPKG